MKRAMIAVAAMLSFSAEAYAQTPPAWSSIPYPEMGNGSAACTHLGGQGDVFCFGIRCTIENTPEWFTYQVGGDSAEGDVRVNLVVDSKNHSTLYMKQASTTAGEWSFSAPYDVSRDNSVVSQLKTGAALYVIVGGVSGAQLSLRGSSREIDRTIAMCSAKDGTSQLTSTSIKEPFDAVLAMASSQRCEATEEQIFNAITNAGFSDWDANQFVVIGVQNATLRLIDRNDFKYQVSDCKPQISALKVDGKAEQLSLSAAQLPQSVRSALKDIETMCGPALRVNNRSKNSMLAEDIDGDGIYDFLLDHAQFCPDAIMTMCGASHCPYTLFVSAKGDWRRFDFILQGYKEFSPQGFLFECTANDRKAGVFMQNGKLTERNC